MKEPLIKQERPNAYPKFNAFASTGEMMLDAAGREASYQTSVSCAIADILLAARKAGTDVEDALQNAIDIYNMAIGN